MNTDPKILAWRLISAALDHDSHTKALYSILALRDIRNSHTVTDVLCELADIAADLMRPREHAYDRALAEIQQLTVEPDQRTPRPIKDRPIRRNK